MSIKTRFIFTCCCLLVGLPSFGQAATQKKPSATEIANSFEPDASLVWAEFSSASGRFTIAFPGTPRESRQDLPIPGEPIVLHLHMLRLLADAEYSVMWSDYPFDPSTKGSIDKFLDAVVSGGVAESGNDLLAQSKSEVSGYPCRDLRERETVGKTMRAKICIVGPRLYQVAITYPALSPDAKEAEERWEQVSDRFLTSFKYLAQQGASSTALTKEEKTQHDRPSEGADQLAVKGEWREIPLIADRVHEFTGESTFTYCVQSPLDIVERFYRAKLEELGWRQEERRWIEQSTFGGHMVLVSFEGSTASVVLTIVENPAEGHTMISLARFEKPRD